MRSSALVALAGAVSAQAAALKGFNYGSTFTDGSNKQQSDFEAVFNRQKTLQGTEDFSAARLYTMIQGGTTNDPISAIPAAIATKTSLLLGMWASGGQTGFDNELAALKSAIKQYGSRFTDLVVGLSVGSEDLYRISPTGIENDSGVGASPQQVASFIGQTKSAIANTPASSFSIGHVDTWTAWVNGSNDAVISAVDWLGVDSYPYFETTQSNGIENNANLFFQSYNATVGAAGGKDVWITETGYPVSGKTANLAVPSVQNAETYWQEVGCKVLGNINTFWYTLQDADPTTPNPSFGIIGSDLSAAPQYDLTCKNTPVGPSSSSGSSASHTATATSSKKVPPPTGIASTKPGDNKSSTMPAGSATSPAVPTGTGSSGSSGSAPGGSAPAPSTGTNGTSPSPSSTVTPNTNGAASSSVYSLVTIAVAAAFSFLL